jgi:hypothetical protein
MFESFDQCLSSGRYVEFHDDQGDRDREHAVGERLEAAGEQEAAAAWGRAGPGR